MAMVTTASREANKVCISYPPYGARVRIRPPAITEAIWPETLTLMEYISVNVSGQIASVIAGGLILTLVS